MSDDTVNCPLEPGEMQAILQALSEAPYRVAAPIITKLIGFAQAHQAAVEAAGPAAT